MSSTSFTFLNATGAPVLSQLDSKLMRSHITKKNFANRRQRIIDAAIVKEKSKGLALKQVVKGRLSQDVPAVAPPGNLPLATPSKESYHYAEFRKSTARLTTYATNRL